MELSTVNNKQKERLINIYFVHYRKKKKKKTIYIIQIHFTLEHSLTEGYGKIWTTNDDFLQALADMNIQRTR